MEHIVGRLAPSPTGAQHIGNARTYLLAWLSGRARGGRCILRIEDLDSPRIKTGAEQQAIDDLHWLGLDWDEGPDVGGPLGPYRQTERLDLYRDALASLARGERVYPCTCSRSDVADAASAPHGGNEGPPYPGTCSARKAADAARLSVPYSWRFRSQLQYGLIREYADRACGEQHLSPGDITGDYVVWRAARKEDAGRDPPPAYQLAVVVDDAAMGITQVCRGDDLIPSTFRQLELYRAFGWNPPEFAHVGLVVGTDGRRLAKRHGDTRLASLRAAGVDPRALVGLLAWSCGLIDKPEPCEPRELIAGFDFRSLAQRWVLRRELLASIGYSQT